MLTMRNVSSTAVSMDSVAADKRGKIHAVGANAIALSISLLGKMYVSLYVLLIYDANEFYTVHRAR